MSQTEFTVDRDKLEVRITKTLKASRERLWEAFTDPEQIVQWWGPRKYKSVIEHDDLRVGGTWRYVHIDESGNEYAFRGEYKLIEPPVRLVRTFEFEPMPGHVLEESMVLEELPDGQTKLNAVSRYASLEDLDGMVASGMESGARESYDRLVELVEAA